MCQDLLRFTSCLLVLAGMLYLTSTSEPWLLWLACTRKQVLSLVIIKPWLLLGADDACASMRYVSADVYSNIPSCMHHLLDLDCTVGRGGSHVGCSQQNLLDRNLTPAITCICTQAGTQAGTQACMHAHPYVHLYLPYTCTAAHMLMAALKAYAEMCALPLQHYQAAQEWVEDAMIRNLIQTFGSSLYHDCFECKAAQDIILGAQLTTSCWVLGEERLMMCSLCSCALTYFGVEHCSSPMVPGCILRCALREGV